MKNMLKYLCICALITIFGCTMVGCEKDSDYEAGELIIHPQPKQDPFFTNTLDYATFIANDGGLQNIIKPLPKKYQDLSGTISVRIRTKCIAEFQGGLYHGYKVLDIKVSE